MKKVPNRTWQIHKGESPRSVTPLKAPSAHCHHTCFWHLMAPLWPTDVQRDNPLNRQVGRVAGGPKAHQSPSRHRLGAGSACHVTATRDTPSLGGTPHTWSFRAPSLRANTWHWRRDRCSSFYIQTQKASEAKPTNTDSGRNSGPCHEWYHHMLRPPRIHNVPNKPSKDMQVHVKDIKGYNQKLKADVYNKKGNGREQNVFCGYMESESSLFSSRHLPECNKMSSAWLPVLKWKPSDCTTISVQSPCTYNLNALHLGL